MPTCLLGLGSNLGDREATLRSAIDEIGALPDVQVLRHSQWHHSRPLGGPAGQGEFLNAAALIETRIAPLPLLDELRNIELRHGRTRAERWAPRTLDIDLLVYESEVMETELLTLPHPRMSFRRFVLEPAAEIAPKMLHPIIGWPVERLLLHLNQASDQLAIVSPSQSLREELVQLLAEKRNAPLAARPHSETADHHWPPWWSEWISLSTKRTSKPGIENEPLPYAAAAFPKLSILLDADIAHRGAEKLKWSTLVRQPGRGPTLRLQTSDWAKIQTEVPAAVDAVWPDLGP